jgi:Uma2 family endonuclease
MRQGAATLAPTRPATLPLHRLDVQTYNRMVVSGLLEGERVELLDGLVVDLSPHSPQHAAAIRMLTRHFAAARAWLQVQLPIEVAPDSAPEPDLALLAHQPPADRHPTTALLVIEIAVSSQAIDAGIKARLYAAAGIPTYWLIDLPARTVEVRTMPGLEGYLHREIHASAGGKRLPCLIDGVEDLDLQALFAEFGG